MNEFLGRTRFRLVETEDVGLSAATISFRRMTVSEKYRDELIALDGAESYLQSMKLNQAVYDLTSSGRLSRLMFLARRS
jgi:hypothetical protein